MNFSSKLLENAVDEFSKLPGVGKRTALRFVLHLLKQDGKELTKFGQTFISLEEDIRYCSKCHNVSDKEVCDICSNTHRDHSTICVIEDIRDFMAIEGTQQYSGIYHLLGGIISPMDGIGPSDLTIDSLISKVESGDVKEIIMALSTTMEGDTTNFYIYKRLQKYDVKVSTIARGIAFETNWEFADEITLGRSILNRTPYESSLQVK